MDSVTSFIYGMSMMFFSMMAFLFWRKGKEMLFRMIMWLMIVVDLQLVKDMVFFLIYGFDNEHAWYLTSSLDMMIIPFYSFVLMDLVKPGWFRWLKALMLELPFLLLPVFYIFTHNIIWFYGAFCLGSHLWMLSCFVIKVDYDNIYMVSSLILWMLIDYFVYRHESVIEELSDIEIVPLEQNEVDVSGMAAEVQRLFEED